MCKCMRDYFHSSSLKLEACINADLYKVKRSTRKSAFVNGDCDVSHSQIVTFGLSSETFYCRANRIKNGYTVS